MARLRWMENARTGGEGTVCTHDNKLYFDDENAYICASASATLDLVATTIAVTGNQTISGNLVVTGGLTYGSETVSLNQNLQGTLTVGINDTGYDVKFYGKTSGKYWLWDESADGVVLVGSFAQTGAATISSTLGVTGNSTFGGTLAITGNTTVGGTFGVTGATTLTSTTAIGDDVTVATDKQINFYDTGASIQASSQNTLALAATTAITITATGITLEGAITVTGAPTITGNVTLAGASTFTSGSGTITLSGSMAATKALTFSPAAAGTFLDFALETEWVNGTLIRADFGGATTLDNDAIGMLLDFNGNITMTTDKDVKAIQVKLPALTQASANTTIIYGFDLPTAGALVQNTLEGTITSKAVNLQLPNTTQTTGTVNSYGIYIGAGTVTSGTQVGIYIGSTLTTGIDINACEIGIDFSGACTTAAISMNGATFANGDHEIEMRENVDSDKTVICSGTATSDAAIVTAVGADADIADGSLYMSCTDGAGALFCKINDVWTTVVNA